MAAVAIPQYQAYTINGANNACETQARALADKISIGIHDPAMAMTAAEYTAMTASTTACESILPAALPTAFPVTLTATPKAPGTGTITITR